MPDRTPGVPLLLLLLSCLAVHPAAAQVQVIEGRVPPDIQEQAFEFLNSPEVVRLSGGIRIPAESRIEGNVAVLGGSVLAAGTVGGDLLVVNGDLRLLPGARIEGQIVVIGGTIVGEEDATLAEEAVVYTGPLRYRIRAGRVDPRPDEGVSPGFLSSDLGFGEARFTLRAASSYNRVEGLPVLFGPLIQTAGGNPTRLETFAIWRSTSGLNLDSDRLGYLFRIDQAVGGRGITSIGATAHREVVPFEDAGLTNTEASLATFLLGRDFRDHYEREGWRAYFSLRPGRVPLSASLSYREEEHLTPPIRDPWTLGSGEDPWRPLPMVAEGRSRSLEATLEWDSTDDPSLPTDGWRAMLGLRRQVGGELALPHSEPNAPTQGDATVTSISHSLPFYTVGTLDLRRYARVGPTSRLNLRAAATGSLTGSPLPPQLQTAAGGEGSLPGHRRFALDCGARQTSRLLETHRSGDGQDPETAVVFPSHGCDRLLLFQAEFQGALPISWDPIPSHWDDSELSELVSLQPVWAVFFNAGQGWSEGDLATGIPRTDSPTRADVGVGFFMGPVGLYWSYPLNRRDRGLNFFVRLQQRF